MFNAPTAFFDRLASQSISFMLTSDIPALPAPSSAKLIPAIGNLRIFYQMRRDMSYGGIETK